PLRRRRRSALHTPHSAIDGGAMGRWGDVAAGILVVALGVGICLSGVRLTLGSALDPQPGFFPFIGGALLIGLAVLLVIQGIRGGGPPAGTRKESLAPPAVLVAGLVGYAALLEWAGYPVMTSLVALLALRVLGTRWLPGIIGGALLSVGSYLLFVKLGVPLPPGQLFGG
ncbi:MAG: tripartite tricarboxylate transporter TctB family protein, partial [Nitrospinota bacterium]